MWKKFLSGIKGGARKKVLWIIAGVVAVTLILLLEDGAAAREQLEHKLANAQTTILNLTEERNALQAQWDENAPMIEKYKELDAAEVAAAKAASELKEEKDRQEKIAMEEAERKKEEAAQASAEAAKAAEKAAAEAEAARGYETGITYQQLARTPDAYKDKKVKFSGRVVQVIDGDPMELRIATDGGYDDVILVEYDASITSQRVLEDDSIRIYGVSKGLYTYESTMGAAITLPHISVDKLEFL